MIVKKDRHHGKSLHLQQEARKKFKQACFERRIETGYFKPCEYCSRKAATIVAHHEDYDKPLDVVWLCGSCHMNLHNHNEVGRKILSWMLKRNPSGGTMKCTNEIEIYETNGKDSPIGNYPLMLIASHWNRKDTMVNLIIGGKEYAVLASELIASINNCTNTG